MKLAQWISAPFAQPEVEGTGAPKIESTPALPMIVGHDDSVVHFRSRLMKTQVDGPELVSAFDRMASRHARIAAQVVTAGSLGVLSLANAVDSIKTYASTGVAMPPRSL